MFYDNLMIQLFGHLFYLLAYFIELLAHLQGQPHLKKGSNHLLKRSWDNEKKASNTHHTFGERDYRRSISGGVDRYFSQGNLNLPGVHRYWLGK